VINLENEQKNMHEFSEFVEAAPIAPGRRTDLAVLRRVEKDFRPAAWKVYAKLTLIEATSGLLTLTVCPQFGLGFSRHHPVMDTLHTAMPPAIFYLFCGLFFVILGSTMNALALSRHEIRTLGKNRIPYFAVYSALAYLSLLNLGTEFFVVSSLSWVFGAVLGTIGGFEAGTRLRKSVWQTVW
jgi:hypothetical protein